ncbi:MAG: hypothetical protein ACRD2W_15475 [Acidimicrobiales bacterium]
MASEATAAPSLSQIAKFGFGDPQNSYAWSTAWFKGNLYVGTARSTLCVEGATQDFYFPNQGFYKTRPTLEVSCPANKFDMNLSAEIWRYSPTSNSWTRVYKSPNDVPIPGTSGKVVARDIGFRGMVVMQEPNGTEALYVGGVTAGEYIPAIAQSNPPRILRTTDGNQFTPLNGSPAQIKSPFGSLWPIGYRAMAVYKDRLFVSASISLTGDGGLVEVGNPWSASPTFTQLSPETMQVFELEVFNGHLYLGNGDSKTNTGYSVYRTDANTTPTTFTPVITLGAGRGSTITSVVAMHVFQNRLYIGASGWFSTLFPASELVRINADDSWDLVVGNARATPQGNKSPISGFGDGFGNIFNAHFWRAVTYLGGLHVGTNDWSWTFRFVPDIDRWLRPIYGFDVWSSCDGQSWTQTTGNAFGDGLYNFGARTMTAVGNVGYLGSANHVQGAAVWKAVDMTSCQAVAAAAPASLSAGTAEPLPPSPGSVLTEAARCSRHLSWDAAAGASRYRVVRSEYVPVDIRIEPPPPRIGPDMFSAVPRAAAAGSPTARSATVHVLSDQRVVGVSDSTTFVDRTATEGREYLYQVVADRVDRAMAERTITPRC